MTPTPTGQLVRTRAGRDLVLLRTVHVPVTDVWAAFTRPEVTGRWFATWSGEARAGTTVRATLTGEEGAQADIRIEACAPPRQLAVSSVDDGGTFRLEVTLAEEGDDTTVTFVHHLDDDTEIGSIGPGWEYYLDRLVAVLLDGPEPRFEDYYPAQQGYYQDL